MTDQEHQAECLEIHNVAVAIRRMSQPMQVHAYETLARDKGQELFSFHRRNTHVLYIIRHHLKDRLEHNTACRVEHLAHVSVSLRAYPGLRTFETRLNQLHPALHFTARFQLLVLPPQSKLVVLP